MDRLTRRWRRKYLPKEIRELTPPQGRDNLPEFLRRVSANMDFGKLGRGALVFILAAAGLLGMAKCGNELRKKQGSAAEEMMRKHGFEILQNNAPRKR
jgi:hypothetical protein